MTTYHILPSVILGPTFTKPTSIYVHEGANDLCPPSSSSEDEDPQAEGQKRNLDRRGSSFVLRPFSAKSGNEDFFTRKKEP